MNSLQDQRGEERCAQAVRGWATYTELDRSPSVRNLHRVRRVDQEKQQVPTLRWQVATLATVKQLCRWLQ